MLIRLLFVCLLALPAMAQYTVEPTASCPSEGVSGAVKATLETAGYRVKEPGGEVLLEACLRKAIPTEKASEERRGSDYPTLALGTVLGVIRFAKQGGDFRAQPIRAGVYTMRYGLQPEDGNHQGASPRRDHVLLMPVEADPNPAAMPVLDELVEMSKKASGTEHPQVLFLVAPSTAAKFPSLGHESGREVLFVKSGAVALGITVVGKAEE